MTLKKRQVKKMGLTPEEIMNLQIAHLKISKTNRRIKFK